MELQQKSVRRQYKARTETSAKNFALFGLSQQSRQTPVLKLCEEIYRVETRGDLRGAAELLAPYWAGFDEELKISALDKLETAHILLRIGSVASALGSAEQLPNSQEKARDCLSLAEDIFDELGDTEGKAQCQNKTGVTYWRNGDLETAQIYFRESLVHALSEESKAIANLNIAMIESLSFRYATALRYYEKAYEFIGNVSVFTEAKIRNGMGLIYKNIGKSLSEGERAAYFDKAIIEFDGAIICYEEAGNSRSEILARNNIGFLYYSTGFYDEAIRVLEIAAAKARLVGDKNNLSVVCDTLARAFIAQGNYRAATSIAVRSVRYLESFENSNLLATALITYGTALARSGETEKAKAAFEQAEEVAAFIQDFILAAAARLFALREMFSEYEPPQRLAAYLYAVKKLTGNQDKDISDALQDVTEKIEAAIELSPPANVAAEFENQERLPQLSPDLELINQPFSLDKKLKTISRQYIETAIRQVEGNQSRAAALLGISRQTFVARIKKDFPDLLIRFNQAAAVLPAEKVEPRALRPISYESAAKSVEELALTEIQADYREIRRGDFLVVRLGSEPQINQHVIIGGRSGNKVKIGRLLEKDSGYFVESAAGKHFKLSEVGGGKDTILGTVAGFCRRADVRKYLVNQKNENGECCDLPCQALRD